MFRRIHKIRRRIKLNKTALCICPSCNYSTLHKQGIPCQSVICPHCQTPLVRDFSNTSNTAPDHKATVFLPKVDVNKCIGCGACINVCPNNAIKIEIDKAKIIEDKCKNCRKCEHTCPVNAIS